VIGDFSGRDCERGAFEMDFLIVEKNVRFEGF
jgi:hypothetical protein